MAVRITISVDEQIKRTLSIMARKNKNMVSGFISELVKRESIREDITVVDSRLGSLLRAHHPVLKNDSEKEYKEILGELRDEKHLK